MTYPDTPELDKLRETMEVQEFTQRLGEAFEGSELNLVLARRRASECHKCNGFGEVYNYKDNEDVECDRCLGSGLDPEFTDLEEVGHLNRHLAALMGLDYDKMEAERDAVLKYVQAKANA